MGDFWRARDQWQSGWSSDPEDRSLVVYVLLLVIPDSLYRISYQLSAIPSRCGSCVDSIRSTPIFVVLIVVIGPGFIIFLVHGSQNHWA